MQSNLIIVDVALGQYELSATQVRKNTSLSKIKILRTGPLLYLAM
jgi:hypothetical protein